MIRGILKYSILIVAAVLVGYGGLAVYEEVTQSEAARVSASVQLAENQAENMHRALGDVSVFADGSLAATRPRLNRNPQFLISPISIRSFPAGSRSTRMPSWPT